MLTLFYTKKFLSRRSTMPIYEYICQNCNKRFSLLQSIFHDDDSTECSACGSKNVKKIVSSFSCGAGSGESVAPASGFGGG
jgi:putative FmdB family regulatory protein